MQAGPEPYPAIPAGEKKQHLPNTSEHLWLSPPLCLSLPLTNSLLLSRSSSIQNVKPVEQENVLFHNHSLDLVCMSGGDTHSLSFGC